MTDDEYEAEKARVSRLFNRWTKPLGLGFWRWEFTWHREHSDSDPMKEDTTLLNIRPQWEYLSAHVNVYLPSTEKRSEGDLEQDVVHELCHALIAEVAGRKTTDDQVERVTSMLAAAFVWIRDRTAEGLTPHRDAPEDPPVKAGVP